ncbi:MAG: Hsp70 family protein, partial [Anaerolineae bacterium]|nr:Hsp70 family protein [Anaerolineae bacterium]
MSTFVRDVYVKTDALTPGRLLRSLKSGLATGYEGTKIFDRYYALEDLLTVFLGEIRRRVEHESGEQVDGVVLGRPVHFVGSAGEPDNQLAVERLAHAAQKAGFADVDFELEPVAAALHYALTLRGSQNILVFDLGGGTLDLTVMRVGEAGPPTIFATGGLGIAGDVFDQRIIEGMLLDHLGRGSTWGDPPAPFPAQYTEALINWQTIPELNRPETLHFLQLAQLTGSHPKQIQALRSLIVNNYALRMVDEVERAKIALSDTFFTAIQLAGEDIDIWQPLARSQFEALIADETARVETCLQDTLIRSGLSAAEIDAVVRTGGSAQIPRFVHMLERIFGADKTVAADAFSSVTAGLAVRAYIERR